MLWWSKARLSLAVGLLLLAVYVLSFSGKFHVMDELAVFTAGHSLAQHGRADINPLIWTNHWTPNPPGIWGQDGNLYTKKAPGISLLVAPLIWLGNALPGLNAVHVGLLTNALVTALTASVLLLWLTDLGFSRSAAVLTALGYGLCTVAWVYARMFWESSPLALCFLLMVWAAHRASHSERPLGWLILCGMAGAVGLTLRFETAPAILFVAGYLWVTLSPSRTPSRLARKESTPGRGRVEGVNGSNRVLALTVYVLPALIIGLGLLYFNLMRYGSLTETGYSQEVLFEAPWIGGYGLLFSPGRGLFIYAPLMLLLFAGIGPAWNRLSRPYFWLIAGLCVFYWLFYGAWFAWGGTWGWGPRFLLPILPLLMLFVAAPIQRALQPAAYVPRLIIGILALVSIGVNLLGIAVDFNEHFLRLGRNDNFVFNWAAFPPLGHWRILQEGLTYTDIIWLHPEHGILWAILAPALGLLAFATLGLWLAITERQDWRVTLAAFVVTPLLIFVMLRASANRAPLALPVTDTLNAEAHPGDALLVSLPPFGDVQEVTTQVMAFVRPALPAYIWIESPPRAITEAERANVWRVALQRERLWLFERWLTQQSPTSDTARFLNQHAFPLSERWFPGDGRLTLYSLARQDTPAITFTPEAAFRGGVSITDVHIMENTLAPGSVAQIRLTWTAGEVQQLAAESLPAGPFIAFVQLVNEAGAITQQDRLLLDLQQIEQSPLLPGQTVAQGYGLMLPPDVPAGTYPLIAGVYDAPSGQRLRTSTGDDFVYLTDIAVE